MEQGWIKLHRKLLNNAMMTKSAYLHLWIVLLLKANHKQTEFIFNNDKVVLQPGQLLTGRKKLKEHTGIPESTIYDILQYLEKQHQIQQQKTTKFSIISIVNWEKYQCSDETQQQTDNKPTSSQQPVDTYKNVKNEKNANNRGGCFSNNNLNDQKESQIQQWIKELQAEGEL